MTTAFMIAIALLMNSMLRKDAKLKAKHRLIRQDQKMQAMVVYTHS